MENLWPVGGHEVAATCFEIQLRSSVSQWPERVKCELQSPRNCGWERGTSR